MHTMMRRRLPAGSKQKPYIAKTCHKGTMHHFDTYSTVLNAVRAVDK